MAFLMALKLSNPSLYNQLNGGTKTYLEVIDLIIKENKENKFFQENEWIKIELILHKSFYKGDDPDKFVDERNNANDQYSNYWGENYRQGIRNYREPHKISVKLVELSERFST